MRQVKRFTILFAAIALAFAGSLFAASPASAGTSGCAYTSDGRGFADGAGSMCFEDYGDIFFLCDNASDGGGQYGEYFVNGNVWNDFNMSNSGGYGSCNKDNLNFPEGASVKFHVCMKDDGTTYSDTCSPWRYRTA